MGRGRKGRGRGSGEGKVGEKRWRGRGEWGIQQERERGGKKLGSLQVCSGVFPLHFCALHQTHLKQWSGIGHQT